MICSHFPFVVPALLSREMFVEDSSPKLEQTIKDGCGGVRPLGGTALSLSAPMPSLKKQNYQAPGKLHLALDLFLFNNYRNSHQPANVS